MNKKPRTTAIIVAAGSSSRMGGQVSKQLIEICGKPVIAHTLAAFENALTVDDIIIAVRKQDMIAVYDIISYFGVKKVKSVVCGGTTRQQSVLSGLECAGDADYIAVHDGARALVRSGQIDEVISAAYTYKAAMLGVPMKDTVKTVGKNRIDRYGGQEPYVVGSDSAGVRSGYPQSGNGKSHSRTQGLYR